MKNYNLNEIEPVLIRCKDYVLMMTNFYKRGGVKVPREVKELKEDLTDIINKIEGEVKWIQE